MIDLEFVVDYPVHLTASIHQGPQIRQAVNHIYRLSSSLVISFKALQKNCAGGW